MSGAGDIKLLLSDVDGTLVTHDKILTPAAIAAVKDLRAAGIGFTVTSARPARGLIMLIERLGLTEPVAGFNGGVLANPDLSVIETHAIDPAAAHATVKLLKDHRLDIWVYDADEWFVHDLKAPHVEREAWILKFGPKMVSAFTDAQIEKAIKIVGVSDDHDAIARCEQAAQGALGETVSATSSAPYFLDVTNAKATKGFVVTTLAKRLNILPSEIATIGDMQNDVLMFKQSGFSIAMGNASDAVKAQASAVTDSNEADGFAKAVRKFLLRAEAA